MARSTRSHGDGAVLLAVTARPPSPPGAGDCGGGSPARSSDHPIWMDDGTLSLLLVGGARLHARASSFGHPKTALTHQRMRHRQHHRRQASSPDPSRSGLLKVAALHLSCAAAATLEADPSSQRPSCADLASQRRRPLHLSRGIPGGGTAHPTATTAHPNRGCRIQVATSSRVRGCPPSHCLRRRPLSHQEDGESAGQWRGTKHGKGEGCAGQ